jgi:hypothetical protein
VDSATNQGHATPPRGVGNSTDPICSPR